MIDAENVFHLICLQTVKTLHNTDSECTYQACHDRSDDATCDKFGGVNLAAVGVQIMSGQRPQRGRGGAVLVCMGTSQGQPAADRWCLVVSGSQGLAHPPNRPRNVAVTATNTMPPRPCSTASCLNGRQTSPLDTNPAWPGNSMLRYMTLTIARPCSRLRRIFDSSLS